MVAYFYRWNDSWNADQQHASNSKVLIKYRSLSIHEYFPWMFRPKILIKEGLTWVDRRRRNGKSLHTWSKCRPVTSSSINTFFYDRWLEILTQFWQFIQLRMEFPRIFVVFKNFANKIFQLTCLEKSHPSTFSGVISEMARRTRW